jgi:hypothetical protein
MKIAYYTTRRELTVTTPQQLGKVIKEIAESRSWRKDRVRQEVVTGDDLVTRIQWVVKDSPEWPVYNLAWCYLTPRQEQFIEWSRRSRLMASAVLKLETLDIRALLLQEGDGSWSWDDTMEWSLSLRQIRNINKRMGHVTRIVRPATLYEMWKKGRIL